MFAAKNFFLVGGVLSTKTPTVDYLVVAAGGGGASRYGPGGGGGGYRTDTGFAVTANTNITVTVGAGGAGSTNTTTFTGSANGEASVFSTISSAGGGGVNTSPQSGKDGGSGGGASGSASGGTGNTPSTSPSQGNHGGGGTLGQFTGGGGGGAGAVGASAATNAGNGGVGISNPVIPNYSITFNGSTNYLTVASNAAFQLGTGNYTFETWIYPTSLGVNNTNSIINIGTYITGLFIRSNGTTAGLQVWTLGTSRLSTTTGLTANAWQHIALVRSGSACTLYINGAVNGTFTDSSSISPATATLTVGRAAHSPFGEYFTGYMSNYRLVKGTAVYTAVFSVPSPPLSAITNTSLLIAQSSTIIDNSGNGFPITSGGSPAVSSSVTPPVYAGGGGGGKFGTAGAGVGGGGGGGNGSDTATGTAGTANTGGGGGGGSGTSGGFNGGSGVVVIVYPNTYPDLTSVAATLTCNGSAGNTVSDITSRSGYKVYKFTAGTGNIVF